MKREEVQALVPGLGKESLDGIMQLHGADIEGLKNERTALQAKIEGLTVQLKEASGKLEGYDPGWRDKAAAAAAEADRRVAALEAGFAAERAAAGLHFSSESAKKAFLADLGEKGLPLEGGKLLGFEDFVQAYKRDDPGAFLPEDAAPRFVESAPGTPVRPSGREAANAAFRDLLRGL